MDLVLHAIAKRGVYQLVARNGTLAGKGITHNQGLKVGTIAGDLHAFTPTCLARCTVEYPQEWATYESYQSLNLYPLSSKRIAATVSTRNTNDTTAKLNQGELSATPKKPYRNPSIV